MDTSTIDTLLQDVFTRKYCTPEEYAQIQGHPPTPGARFLQKIINGEGYLIPIRYHARRGAAANPASDRQRQPWLALGVSEATFYRHKLRDARLAEGLAALGVKDSEANRTRYARIQRAAALTGQSVAGLWGLEG